VTELLSALKLVWLQYSTLFTPKLISYEFFFRQEQNENIGGSSDLFIQKKILSHHLKSVEPN